MSKNNRGCYVKVFRASKDGTLLRVWSNSVRNYYFCDKDEETVPISILTGTGTVEIVLPYHGDSDSEDTSLQQQPTNE